MANRLQRVVIACGGTGGHVYPAIAIARELSKRSAESITFMGRPDSFESTAIAREGFSLDTVSIGRLVGQGTRRTVTTLVQLPMAVLRARRHLRARRPQVVIGTGGFASGPALLAAATCRIPIVVQEQNAVPGLTNRVLSAVASRVALAHSRADAPSPKYRVTGNPVRAAFFDVPPYAPSSPFTLLVLGGSQGARRLNDVALDAAEILAALGSELRIVLQSGPRWESSSRERAASLASASGLSLSVHAFLHDMPERLASASLVLARSGASTIAEICAAGRPSILVPFPHAAGDHQTHNARALADAGAAEWMAESDLTGELLASRIRHVMAEPETLIALASSARALAVPDAAARVADMAAEVAR